MEYTGKLYGKIGRRMIPLTLTSEDVDELERQRDANLEKGRENAALAGDLLSENRRLKLALSRAAKWGIRSDGFSGEVSDSLRIWFDGGMVGDPPAVPSYYPDNVERWHRWGGGGRRNGIVGYSYGEYGRQSSPSGCPAAPCSPSFCR